MLIEWHAIGIAPYLQVDYSDFIGREISFNEIERWAKSYKEAFQAGNIAALLIMENDLRNIPF